MSSSTSFSSVSSKPNADLSPLTNSSGPPHLRPCCCDIVSSPMKRTISSSANSATTAVVASLTAVYVVEFSSVAVLLHCLLAHPLRCGQQPDAVDRIDDMELDSEDESDEEEEEEDENEES
jgi:hypothetical protein